jgi:hypothetical protein
MGQSKTSCHGMLAFTLAIPVSFNYCYIFTVVNRFWNLHIAIGHLEWYF